MVGNNLILGNQWLSTLGLIVADYSLRTMEFELDGTQVHWEGESWIDDIPITSKELCCLALEHSLALLCHIEVNTTDCARIVPATVILMATREVLAKFKGVFAKPLGLAPPCDQDHFIHMNVDAQSMSIRPYRYP